MIWQTPVTLDRRLIGVTWGRTTGIMRTERIQAAYKALARLSKRYNAATQAQFAWPVNNLSLRDDESAMCQLLPSHEQWLRKHIDEGTIEKDLEAFDCLNQCERWALGAILLTAPSTSIAWEDIEVPRPPILHAQA